VANNIFLADINNERAEKNPQYADNLASLDRLVLYRFDDDTTGELTRPCGRVMHAECIGGRIGHFSCSHFEMGMGLWMGAAVCRESETRSICVYCAPPSSLLRASRAP
jgi:hypothetical protein